MEFFNLSTTAYANYLIKTDNGVVLIDCGNNFSYKKFLKKIKKAGVDKNDIKAVVLTHVHQDHLSYLQSLLDDVNPLVVVGKGAVENLKLGHDKLLTYSSPFNKWLTDVAAKFRGGPASWQPIDLTKYNYCELTDHSCDVLKDFGGTVFALPGHTLDSIGIKFGDDFFVGDAIMPMFPAKHGLPLLIEDENAYKKSYDFMLNSGAKKYFSGHGKVVDNDYLKAHKKYVDALKIV